MKFDTGETDFLVCILFLASVYLPIGFGLGFWFHYVFACAP